MQSTFNYKNGLAEIQPHTFEIEITNDQKFLELLERHFRFIDFYEIIQFSVHSRQFRSIVTTDHVFESHFKHYTYCIYLQLSFLYNSLIFMKCINFVQVVDSFEAYSTRIMQKMCLWKLLQKLFSFLTIYKWVFIHYFPTVYFMSN